MARVLNLDASETGHRITGTDSEPEPLASESRVDRPAGDGEFRDGWRVIIDDLGAPRDLERDLAGAAAVEAGEVGVPERIAGKCHDNAPRAAGRAGTDCRC